MSDTPFSSRNGVRQGCPLSPLLFNIVMDRVLRTALPQMQGIAMRDAKGPVVAKLHAYEDDIVLFAPSMELAQKDLTVLVQSLAAAGLTVSTSKKKFLQQQDRRRPPPTRPKETPAGIETVEGHLFMVVPATARNIACPACRSLLGNRTTLQKHLREVHALTVSVGTNPPRKVENPPPFQEDPEGRLLCPECRVSLKDQRQATVTNCPKGAMDFTSCPEILH